MCARRKKKKYPLPVVVAALCVCAFTLYRNVNAPNQTDAAYAAEQPVSTSDNEAPKREGKPAKTDNLLLPSYLTDRNEEIVRHEGFVLSYNSRHLLPNWVSWLLTRERTKGKEKRADNFQPDTDIRKGPIAEDSDYRGSGFDRGHMCPSADCKHSRESQNQCFLLSNICPQTHALNAGDWKELEELTRDWAQRYDSIYVVCGPVIEHDKEYKTIGENGVTVPERYFKVLWRNTSDAAVCIGFIFENGSQNKPLSAYALSVDDVEKETGINFFSKFPKHIECKAESSVDVSQWKGLK
ncbi:MAG: DNA/RNA non-specific endonuclease [Bacteroidaceae bacterium]|nr:DNA/RNA non-specific endonuclease [Bacteroidaceae bacterium]